MRVTLTTTDSVTWECTRGRIPDKSRHLTRELKQWLEKNALQAWGTSVDLPIMVFYDTDRAVIGLATLRRQSAGETNRYSALAGALSARTSFREFFDWFYAKENEELREQRSRRNLDYRLKDLSAVRQAISSMLDGVSEPHVELRPTRFVVSEKSDNRPPVVRTIDQLSGGCRAVLALAADLAWRMAQGNPDRINTLESEAVVLIDEVELHLHPAWQQRILDDLMRTFPNAQFIVSTHSPQVLTTVHPAQIVELQRDGDDIVASIPNAPTFGAEAGDVLSSVMGVNERPSVQETHSKPISKSTYVSSAMEKVNLLLHYFFESNWMSSHRTIPDSTGLTWRSDAKRSYLGFENPGETYSDVERTSSRTGSLLAC